MIAIFLHLRRHRVILTEVEKQGLNVRRRIGELVAVQGFGRPVAQNGPLYKENFFSGSSAKGFTPDTADMSLNPENRQGGNIQRKFYFQSISYKIFSLTFYYRLLPQNTPFFHQDYCNSTARI
jgi:hypothetical protein